VEEKSKLWFYDKLREVGESLTYKKEESRNLERSKGEEQGIIITKVRGIDTII
jgi:hypothetical protein